MLGMMMVSSKCQGYSKQLWLFILLVFYSVFCPCPDVCDEDLSVGM